MGITIHDVAERAGVSTATVSHVLNRSAPVAPRTRRQVLAAVRYLDYHPNAHARHLASGRSRTMGIIISDIENPFFPEVMKGFEARAHQRGYEVILGDTNYDPILMRRATERMFQHQVRGVAVMTSEFSLELIREIARRRIAITFLDLGSVQEYVSNIMIDYTSGIRQVVEHLHELGHRRIVFASGRRQLKSNVVRHQAFIESMRALGLEGGPTVPGNLRFEGGVAAGKRILEMKSMPTAVVSVNDLTAVGIIKSLTEAGIRIPQDISVAGFDKTRLSEYINPSVTTVDIHRDEIGRVAADALCELCASPDSQGKEYHIPAELVVRQSTGPAPTGKI